MRIGAAEVTGFKIGSADVTAIYIGATLVWSPATGFSWTATGIAEAVEVEWTGSNTFTATGIAEAVTVEWT